MMENEEGTEKMEASGQDESLLCPAPGTAKLGKLSNRWEVGRLSDGPIDASLSPSA